MSGPTAIVVPMMVALASLFPSAAPKTQTFSRTIDSRERVFPSPGQFIGKGGSMKSLAQLALVLCLAVSTFASEGRAAPVQVWFSGEIDFVDDPNGYLPGGFGVGNSFSGTYVVDSDPLGPGNPVVGLPGALTYPQDSSSVATATVGGSSVSASGGIVQIGNDTAQDGDAWAVFVFDVAGFSCIGNCVVMAVGVSDPTLTRLTDSSYFVNTSLAGWTGGGTFGILDANSLFPIAVGTINSLGITPGAPLAFNIDLGYVNGTPSSSYGAAGPTGTWNLINGFSSTSLADTDGNPSGVSATLATFSDGGSVPGPATDAHALLGDHALDCAGALLEWELAVDGLPDGDYRVWLYAPMDATVETGDVEVNGVMVASIPGDASGALIEGTSYARVDVSVSGGALGFYALGTGAAACAGVAGIQIEGPLATPVPALATPPRALLAALLAAGAGTLYCRRQGRREAQEGA